MGAARVPEEVLELVGLGSVSESKVRTLSGGQRRRLDVALGIINMPNCSSSTNRRPGSIPKPDDASGTSSGCWPRDGTTILLTTHYLEEAAALADRVAVIAGGQGGGSRLAGRT